MIDDFRRRVARTWRCMGGHLTKVAHAFDNNNASLSEGGPLAVVVEDFPESVHQTRDNTGFPHRLRLACLPLARSTVRGGDSGAGAATRSKGEAAYPM